LLGLAIECADRAASAALWRSNQGVTVSDDNGKTAPCSVVDDVRLSPDDGKADQLIGQIERLLERQAVGYGDLDVIAINRGPGSFTGIRSGVALARGLALAADLPVIGISTHEALAARLERDAAERPVQIVLDARRGEVYAQGFYADGTPSNAIEARTPAAVAADLRTGSWRLAGPGAGLITERLDAAAKVEMIDMRPTDAAAVAYAAALRLSAGERPVKGFDLRPLYIRGPDAKPPKPLMAPTRNVEVLP